MTQPLKLDHAGLNGLSEPVQAEDALPQVGSLQTSLDTVSSPLSHTSLPESHLRLSDSDPQPPRTPTASVLESQRQSHSQSRLIDGSPARSPSVSSAAQPDGYRRLIARSFAPRVAVFASPDTEELIRGKGLKDGLCSLLRPFGETIPGKVVIRDSVGASKGWDDFGIRFVHSQVLQHSSTAAVSGASGLWDSQARFNGAFYSPSQRPAQDPSSSVEASLDKYLRTVYRPPPENEKPFLHFNGGARQEHDVESSPVYQTFLRRLLSSSPMVPYETFSHPVTCLIVVSSHNPAPIDALRKLYASTGHGSHNVPQWMGTEYLRYYVLIHDEENDDITKSTALFDLMKRHFGLHCHLLRLKSSQCIESDDDSFQLPSVEWLSADEEMAIERMKGKPATEIL